MRRSDDAYNKIASVFQIETAKNWPKDGSWPNVDLKKIYDEFLEE